MVKIALAVRMLKALAPVLASLIFSFTNVSFHKCPSQPLSVTVSGLADASDVKESYPSFTLGMCSFVVLSVQWWVSLARIPLDPTWQRVVEWKPFKTQNNPGKCPSSSASPEQLWVLLENLCFILSWLCRGDSHSPAAHGLERVLNQTVSLFLIIMVCVPSIDSGRWWWNIWQMNEWVIDFMDVVFAGGLLSLQIWIARFSQLAGGTLLPSLPCLRFQILRTSSLPS